MIILTSRKSRVASNKVYSQNTYHEYVDSKMVKLLSRVCTLYEEEGHAIMDCLFVPFHIRTNIVKHVELHNVAGKLIY